jgi:hypothetical protein
MEEPPAERLRAREEKSDVEQTRLDDALSTLGFSLTIEDVTEGLGVSVGSARALIVAGLRGIRADEE